jgi:predicted histidine transporter YuiF (NhaC family)
MRLAVVDWDALLTVVWASLIAGICAPAAYGLAILGSTRAFELGREGRIAGATIYGLIGAFGVAVVLASVVFGIVVLTDK